MKYLKFVTLLILVLIPILIGLEAVIDRSTRPTYPKKLKEVYIYRDPIMGCQYVSGEAAGALTPRLTPSGVHYCGGEWR